MIWVSVVGYLDVLQYDNDSYYIFDIGILLFLANFYTWLTMNVFMINLWFPIIGPIINYVIMGWVFIEWQRLQLPLWGSEDDDDSTSDWRARTTEALS